VASCGHVYRPLPNGQQPVNTYGDNIIGINQPLSGKFLEDLPKQGGPMSQALNMLPIINTMAGVHDYWFNMPNGPAFTPFNNFGTMLPAQVLAIGAVAGNVTQLTQGYEGLIYTQSNNGN